MMPEQPPQDVLGRLLPMFPTAPAGETSEELATIGDQQPPQDRRTGDVERAPEVHDAEIVDEREYQRSRARRGAAIVARRATVVRHHPITGAVATAGRHGLRHAITAGQGHLVWGKRAHAALTYGVIREQIAQARMAGDQAVVAEWVDRLERARHARHERVQNLPKVMAKGLLSLAVALVVLAGLLTVLGVVFQLAPGGMGWSAWWSLLADIAGLGVWALTAAIHVALWSAVPAWAYTAWRAGQRHAEAPRWLRPAAERIDTTGAPITPSIVVTALRDLGIAELRKAIKAMPDAGAAMLGTIRLAGCGVEVDVLLPSGVSTNEVQDRRRKLAENLDRHEHELFITIPPAPRTVRLWIADPGALDEPIGPSPLVIDPDTLADLYTGRAPWGQNLRGDRVAISLLQRHLLCTGLSNQGKTAALRALALWLALDVSVQFLIADLKGIGDWHMFDGLATTLIEGPTDEHVIQATQMLEWGVAEMERRLAAVDPETHKNGVDRTLALSGKGFHPIVLIVDEAQQAFMCPAVGEDKRPYGGSKNTSRYFMAARKIHNQGRAVNVILWQGTQNPTDQNLPKLVREGAHIRASLVVGTETEARMALGDKAVNAGAAPHKLRQGLDKGTLVVAGDGVELEPGQSSITVRTHFVDGEAADEIAGRAKGLRGGVDTAGGVEVERRDLLADLVEVLGAEDVPAADVPALLSREWPTWAPYRSLNGVALRAQLAELGVRVPSTSNKHPVRREAVVAALAARPEADPGVDGDDRE